MNYLWNDFDKYRTLFTDPGFEVFDNIRLKIWLFFYRITKSQLHLRTVHSVENYEYSFHIEFAKLFWVFLCCSPNQVLNSWININISWLRDKCQKLSSPKLCCLIVYSISSMMISEHLKHQIISMNNFVKWFY